MPKYRFEFPGEPGSQPEYLILPDDGSAETEARHAMADLIMDRLQSSRRIAIDVFDEANDKVMTVRKEEDH